MYKIDQTDKIDQIDKRDGITVAKNGFSCYHEVAGDGKRRG